MDEAERAHLREVELENMALRAVLADLKGGCLSAMSNRRKTELGERLRREYAALRGRVRGLFAEGDRNWGYRTIWARLRREGTRVSEKVVRRLMREEGLAVAYNRRRRRGWSSYEGEVSAAPPNLLARDFSAAAPDERWVTDITEFRLPGAGKVYLSAVVDLFDGVLRQAQERVLPQPRLARRHARGVLGEAGRLPAVLLRGPREALAGVAQPRRVPPQPRLGGLGAYEKTSAPPFACKKPCICTDSRRVVAPRLAERGGPAFRGGKAGPKGRELHGGGRRFRARVPPRRSMGPRARQAGEEVTRPAAAVKPTRRGPDPESSRRRCRQRR